MQIPPQPQFGFPTQAPAQPAAGPGSEWLQAAHHVQMTGQLPPGLTPEMIQKQPMMHSKALRKAKMHKRI